VKHLEDFVVSEEEAVGSHALSREEIVAFAGEWDPQPMHTEGEVIACGAHLVAITIRALVRHEPRVAIIAGLGWDEVRFRAPARAGDRLEVRRRCLEVRPSRSRPDRGIVRNRIELVGADGTIVLDYVDTILIRRRA
jgi:acyl dehydratase